jgi:YD repeat-containing protein
MPGNDAASAKSTLTICHDSTLTLPRRLTSASNPENGTVSYAYNADGTLASKKDFRSAAVRRTAAPWIGGGYSASKGTGMKILRT